MRSEEDQPSFTIQQVAYSSIIRAKTEEMRRAFFFAQRLERKVVYFGLNHCARFATVI